MATDDKTQHTAHGTRLEQVIVEAALDETTLTLLRRGERVCRVMRRVTLQAQYISRDGRRVVCVFAAPDAESVRQLLAGVGLDGLGELRIWTAQRP